MGSVKSNRVVKRSKLVKPPAIMGLVKYDPKEEIHFFGCLKMIIAHNLSQLMALSFISGFIDVNIFVRWGFFGTFQTGNCCFLAMVLFPTGSDAWQFVNSPELLSACIFLGTVGSSFLNSFCLEYTGSREICFVIFTTITCILCGLDGLLTGPDSPRGNSHANPFVLMPLLLMINTLACWSNATGFLTNLMTGNLMKLGKSLYLRLRSYSQGGSKARGDSLTMLMIFISFFGGVLFSVRFHGRYYSKGNTLLPMVFMWPIFMLTSGILPEKYHIIPYLKRMVSSEKEPLKEDTEGSGMSLRGDANIAVSVTGLDRARSRARSIITIHSLAVEDVKAEKEMHLNSILADTNFVVDDFKSVGGSTSFLITQTETPVETMTPLFGNDGKNNDATISAYM